ncbi:TIGR01777 family oxidoreductase [Marinomonas epiphytica]
MMKLLITGLTGFIGQNLLKKLDFNHYQIYALVREPSTRLPSKVIQITLDEMPNEKFDALIHLAGENIAAKPWSSKRKHALMESRGGLLRAIQARLTTPPDQVICFSAMGYYGIRNDDFIDESTPAINDFCHQLCEDTETAACQFKANSTWVFRLAVVLGKGGALEKMRPAYQLCLGGAIGSGQQWFSWIHIEDVIKLTLMSLNQTLPPATYNLSSPQSIRQKQFAKAYALSINRPCLFKTPKWLLSLILGEMSNLLTEGANMQSAHLKKAGYSFEFENLTDALNSLTG